MKPEVQSLYVGKFLELKNSGTWEYVSRVSARGAAFILAVTPQREIVLVEQFRVPIQSQSIELPAGIIGDEKGFEDEKVEAAALRELEEETGYRGTHGELLLTGPSGPGLTSELLHLVQAHNLTRVGPGGGVEGENITVHVVPLASVHEWLAEQSKKGKMIEPRIYAGLYFALCSVDK